MKFIEEQESLQWISKAAPTPILNVYPVRFTIVGKGKATAPSDPNTIHNGTRTDTILHVRYNPGQEPLSPSDEIQVWNTKNFNIP